MRGAFSLTDVSSDDISLELKIRFFIDALVFFINSYKKSTKASLLAQWNVLKSVSLISRLNIFGFIMIMIVR